MPDPSRGPREIVVAGDTTIDWNIAHEEVASGYSVWSGRTVARVRPRPGSAALLAEVVDALVGAGPDEQRWKVRGPEVSIEGASPAGPGPHSFTLWGRFPATGGAKPADVWRVRRHLGLDPGCGHLCPPAVPTDLDRAALLLLVDAGLGLRGDASAWRDALRSRDRSTWIVLKTTSPVAEGELFGHLMETASERLICLLTCSDLRRSDVQISAGGSWERTAQDLYWELAYNPRINELSRARHVIVTLGVAGALVLSRGANDGAESGQASLVFDPRVMEGEWEADHPGSMIGYATCMAAALAGAVADAPDAPDVAHAVRRGLYAMRALHLHGFGEVGSRTDEVDLGFPVRRVADALRGEPAAFVDALVPDPRRMSGSPAARPEALRQPWSILQDRHGTELDALAAEVARRGPTAVLEGVPLGVFGKLVTADRQEIESYREIAKRIRGYAAQDRFPRPLCIGVFGPPGAGKSFGIKQLARTVLPGRVKELEFNLSQFSDPDGLRDALHQVRDAGIAGDMPLVFWDEFDTTVDGRALAWLPHFIAPMWDGKFMHGQITHLIGPAIFVFAGGTRPSMRAFRETASAERYRDVKGRDFVSRLSGHIDVLGPNPYGETPADRGRDQAFVLRRAMILHAELANQVPTLWQADERGKYLSVDPAVLRAMLHVAEYRHGARSIASVIAMSSLHEATRFGRSDLPPEDQLDNHVDSADFTALLHRLDIEGPLLERIAEGVHEHFRRSVSERSHDGHVRGHSADVSYAELPEHEREQNRGFVRDIPSKLAAVGLAMVQARGGARQVALSEEVVEELARLEHDRWMLQKIAQGWRWAPETDKPHKLHKDIVPWGRKSTDDLPRRYPPDVLAAMGAGELDSQARDKDRHLIRAIPEILAGVGYTIVAVDAAPASSSDGGG